MRSFPKQFVGIESAIGELGAPDTIWFRGHVNEHRLLPSLYRLWADLENDHRFASPDQHGKIDQTEKYGNRFDELVAMHHSYVPTRLLAWTKQLNVALFCALIRESNKPAVFVLDPVALNTLSNITSVIDPDVDNHTGDRLLESHYLSSAIKHPIAIERQAHGAASARDNSFTLHGQNRLPLEEQCPDCVRRVLLTEEETSFAREYVLSGDWIF